MITGIVIEVRHNLIVVDVDGERRSIWFRHLDAESTLAAHDATPGDDISLNIVENVT